jgi:predicted nucleic acid-binding protein
VIVVDTNVLYALADRRDRHHAECTEWFRRNDDVLLAPPTVLAEACYLIDRYLGPAAEASFLDSVGIGADYAFQLVGLADSDLRRMAELVRRYADRRLGGTDASVIAVCERLAIVTVATVNLRDFANVRPRHVAALATVP